MDKCKGIYVDIDALFDIKLVLATLLDSPHVKDDIKNKKYFNRYRDNIGNISSDILNSLLRYKTKHLYNLAIPTPILTELLPVDYEDLCKFDSMERQYGLPSIYVNIYPYDFTKEELKRFNYILCKHLKYAEVIFINKSFEYLTPQFISKHIKHMYMVRGLEWIEYQMTMKRLMKKPLVETLLITPMLFDGHFHTSSISNKFIDNLKNSFTTLIDVQFAPVEYFSADKNIIANYKPLQEDTEESLN